MDNDKTKRADATDRLDALVQPCGRCEGSKKEPDGSKCARCGGTGREMTAKERAEWRELIRKTEEDRIKAWEKGLAKIK